MDKNPHVVTYNSTSCIISNDNIKIIISKSMYMRFCWVKFHEMKEYFIFSY